MERFDQRQGFLISATVHVVLLTLLSSLDALKPPPAKKTVADASLSRAHRVMLPPAEVLRQLSPKPAEPRPAPVPVPQATPPPETKGKDRISIGPPSEERAKQLILRKEDDLTAIPKGQPRVAPSLAPTQPPSVAAANESAGPTAREAGAGLRLPPGAQGRAGNGDDRPEARVGPPAPDRAPSIASSLRNLEKRIGDVGPLGVPNGTGQQMGGLFFDPEGADFTVWVNHFKNEVYRNWIMPQPALMGFRGHVDVEFTVERNGALSALRLVKSSGTPALDRAAMNALQASRLLALPADFAPPRVTIQVSFFYNESPRES